MELGCTDAVNIDGGGSQAMYYGPDDPRAGEKPHVRDSRGRGGLRGAKVCHLSIATGI
ncbi:MAG: phosphodiester glycosidase family protein [Clostridiales bacterium]|nr:phosphodiester glycosidase family protein [Clostridiales bacterium]